MVTSHPAPAIPPLLKDLNQRKVLEMIRAAAPISRAEISRRAGISKPTVSAALQALLEAGLVREADYRPDGPSYGALFFEAVPEAALVVGLDLGARFLRGAICDLDGRVRARQDVDISGIEADGAIAAIESLCTTIRATSGLPDAPLDGLVVGVPGVVDVDTGRLEVLTSVPGLRGREFAGELHDRLGLPVVVENDINLSAVGEHWSGVARGIEDFAFLSVGTGVGAGIILRGELYRGRHGAAGEIDLVAAGLNEDIDPSARAVSALAARQADRVDTVLKAPFEVRDIFAAARNGDQVARTVVDEVARRIALHIVPLAAVVDVTPIVLGGGIGANPDLLLEAVQSRVDEWLPYPPRILVSSLGEAAVLTGALAVGLRAALQNVFENRARHQ